MASAPPSPVHACKVSDLLPAGSAQSAAANAYTMSLLAPSASASDIQARVNLTTLMLSAGYGPRRRRKGRGVVYLTRASLPSRPRAKPAPDARRDGGKGSGATPVPLPASASAPVLVVPGKRERERERRNDGS